MAPAEGDPRPGKVLDGRFTLLDVVGVGAMGAVYRALQHSMEREVAVKLLRRSYASDESVVRRFLREAKGASRLRHPGIITLLDFGRSEGGELYLAMELLDGRSLRQLLAATGPLSIERALPLVGQVCDAMDAAHEAGVVHCDLKPENVFLVRGGPSPDGFVKVIDFGIASVKGAGESHAPPGFDGEASTARSTVWGTPEYMSPEQALGEAVDGRSDVYAIGVLLYEMLTGRTPFSGGHPSDVLEAHLRSEPLPPRHLRADLPEAVEAVILSALAKARSHRPATAGELWKRLESAAIQKPAELPSRPVLDRGPRTNLAPSPASFVGRGGDVEAIEKLVAAGHRLVTVHGPAGMGKTRLATEVALRSVEELAPRGGAWFCDLAEAMSQDAICHEVARSLRLLLAVDGSETDQVEQIGRALSSRGRTLLVLDNFEQVAAYAAATVGRWLARAPEATFLITSRARLRLPAEVVHELGPLRMPRRGEGAAAPCEAVRLFVERARAVRPGFELDEVSERAVAEIVRHLDGMPLSIELAAARMGMVTAPGLLERLRKRFDVIADASSTGSGGRQSTLRRAIDWSWSLLSPWESTALAELSVFRGGFTLEAAEAVIDLSVFEDAPSVMDVVQALGDKSLVRTQPTSSVPGEPRFGLYRSIAEHAAGKLAEWGGSGPAAARHASWYLDTCGAWAEGAHGHDGARLRRMLSLERGNLLAVLRRALAAEPPTKGSATRALGALLALDPVLATRGPFRPHLPWLARAVAVCEAVSVEPELLVRGYLARGEAHRVRMQVDAAEADFERALDHSRAAGLRRLEGRALFGLGMVSHRQGREASASPLFEQALEIHREAGDRHSEGRTTGMLGVKLLWVGRLAEARAYLDAALDCLAETGDRWFEGFLRGCLAWLLQESGDLEEARRTYDRALATLREVGAARYEALFTRGRACLDWEEGRMSAARAGVARAVTMAELTGDRWLEANFRANLAAIDADLGHQAEAGAGLELAESGAADAGTAWLGAVVALSGGHLRLVEARQAAADGCVDDGAALLADVDRRIAAAVAPGGPADDYPSGAPPLTDRSDEVRFALRMLRRAREASKAELLGASPAP